MTGPGVAALRFAPDTYEKDNAMPILLWLVGIPIPLIILILLLR